MSCGMGMIKYLLFIFNFIFAVCGIGILAIGVIIHLQLSNLTKTVEMNVMFPSIVLIVIGSIIFVISFFGCCGAIRESHCMTITFASILLFILIIQVAVAVYAFVVFKNEDNQISIKSTYSEIFKGYPRHGEEAEIVNIIQSSLKCCGVNSADDFSETHGNFTGEIPWSCCGKAEREQFCSKSEVKNVPGCADKIAEALKTAGTVLGSVAIGIAGIELVGIIFALCLANSIRNTERRGYRV